ncbi:hypothetical protein EON65_57205 [archaeon]|nr:MAG: hypothetical protein EON65_57205 [archaeon]
MTYQYVLFYLIQTNLIQAERSKAKQGDVFLLIIKAHLLAVMSDLEQIKAKIAVTEAKLKKAEEDGDRDLILALQNTLTEQQKTLNILLASSVG